MNHSLQQVKDNNTTETSASRNVFHSNLSSNSNSELESLLSSELEKLGYELVELEVSKKTPPTLSIVAEVLPDEKSVDRRGMSLDDCVAITKGLDPILETSPLIQQLFSGEYELEVASPGVDRLLTKEKDFQRFTSKEVRVKTGRSLAAAEMDNEEYAKTFSKQKNFMGTLAAFSPEYLWLDVSLGLERKSQDKKSAGKAKENNHRVLRVRIPRTAIESVRLEPRFDFEEEN